MTEQKTRMKVNKTQQVIVAVVVPAIIFFISFGIMELLGNYSQWWRPPPADFSESWWGWLLAVAIAGIFEFFWFRD